MPITKDPVLCVEELKQHFRTVHGIVRAVDGVSFSVAGGETLGLVGESGSGKSTVAYTVAGACTPTAGRIRFKGSDIGRGHKKRSLDQKRRMQMVFQDPGSSLNGARTLRQTLELPLRLYGIGSGARGDRTRRLEALMEKVTLPAGHLYKYPHMLGGGERQMAAIARALAAEPSFVILDEPTSALDVSVQAKIIRMLTDFQQEMKLSYLFITHDLSLMRNVAHRVAVMYLGKLCESAPTAIFFQRHLHPYSQLLLSSIPVISDEEEALKPPKVISGGEIPSPVNLPQGCGFHLRCHRKMGVCETVDPVMREIAPGHHVRCHLYA